MEQLPQQIKSKTTIEKTGETVTGITKVISKETIGTLNDNQVPMDLYKEEVVDCIRNNTNSIIIGETGSGKTTRVPVFLMENFPHAKIAVTQPRRVAVRSIANYVAKQKAEKIGGKIGYQIRFEDFTSIGTQLNFLTDGILLRKISGDPLLKEYDIVMVDEAHERSLNMDFVLALLKRANKLRKETGIRELKIIVASATIEKEKFIKYFEESGCMEVPGRTFPVETIYHNDIVATDNTDPDNFTDFDLETIQNERIKKIIQEICDKNEVGDILIFEPGVGEIQRSVKTIQSLNLRDVKVYPLHAKMDPSKQDEIFQKTPFRKIIIATNIAETSITLEGVRFVIDKGLIRQSEFDTTTGIAGLFKTPHSKSGLNQRKGRAGRTAPGTCHRLFSEENFNSRIEHTIPEISRSDLGSVVLTLKKLGIDNLENFDFIEKIPAKKIQDTIKELQKIQALDENEKITPVGLEMERIPLTPTLSRMVVEGKKRNCFEETCAIATMLPFARNINPPQNSDNEDSDFLTLITAFKELYETDYQSQSKIVENIPPQKRREIKEVFNQLVNLFQSKKDKKHAISFSGSIKDIMTSILSGNAGNMMIYSRTQRFKKHVHVFYKKRREDFDVEAEFNCVNSSLTRRENILIAHSLFDTKGRIFMNTLQNVYPEQIIETLPHLVYAKLWPQKARFCLEKGRVIIPVAYYLKDYDYFLLQTEDDTIFDANLFASIYAEVLINNIDNITQHTEQLRKNKDLFSKVYNIWKRSGTNLPIKTLHSLYSENILGLENIDQVLDRIKTLEVKISDFIDPDTLDKLENDFPATIEIQEYTANLKYKASETEDEHQRQYNTCTVIINPDQNIFLINDSDIDTSKLPKEIPITYRYDCFAEASIEKLKSKIADISEEMAWQELLSEIKKSFQLKWGEQLPSLESIGLYPRKIRISKMGKTLEAFPAWTHKISPTSCSKFNKTDDFESIIFSPTYFKTKEEAEQETQQTYETYLFYQDLIVTNIEGLDHHSEYTKLRDEIDGIKTQILTISKKLERCPFYNETRLEVRKIKETVKFAFTETLQKMSKDAIPQLETIKEKLLEYLGKIQRLQNPTGDLDKLIALFTEEAYSRKARDPKDTLYLIEISNGQVCTLKNDGSMTPVEFSHTNRIPLKTHRYQTVYIDGNVLRIDNRSLQLQDGSYLINIDQNESYSVVMEENSPFGIKEMNKISFNDSPSPKPTPYIRQYEHLQPGPDYAIAARRPRGSFIQQSESDCVEVRRQSTYSTQQSESDCVEVRRQRAPLLQQSEQEGAIAPRRHRITENQSPTAFSRENPNPEIQEKDNSEEKKDSLKALLNKFNQ